MKPPDDGLPDFDSFLDRSDESIKDSIAKKFGIDVMRLIQMETDLLEAIKIHDDSDRGELHDAVKQVLLNYNANESAMLLIILLGSKYRTYLKTNSLHLSSEFSRIPVMRRIHRKDT